MLLRVTSGLESRDESNKIIPIEQIEQNNSDLMKEIENLRKIEKEKKILKIKRFELIENFVANETPKIKEKFEKFEQKLNEQKQLEAEIEKFGQKLQNENVEAEYEAELKIKENLKNEIEKMKKKLEIKEKENNHSNQKNCDLLTIFRT